MRYLFSITLALLITGCYSQPVIKTQEVYIPVKCSIDMPLKPNIQPFNGVKYLNNDISKEYAIYLKNVIDSYKKYVFELEKDLNFCIRGIK